MHVSEFVYESVCVCVRVRVKQKNRERDGGQKEQCHECMSM